MDNLETRVLAGIHEAMLERMPAAVEYIRLAIGKYHMTKKEMLIAFLATKPSPYILELLSQEIDYLLGKANATD